MNARARLGRRGDITFSLEVIIKLALLLILAVVVFTIIYHFIYKGRLTPLLTGFTEGGKEMIRSALREG